MPSEVPSVRVPHTAGQPAWRTVVGATWLGLAASLAFTLIEGDTRGSLLWHIADVPLPESLTALLALAIYAYTVVRCRWPFSGLLLCALVVPLWWTPLAFLPILMFCRSGWPLTLCLVSLVRTRLASRAVDEVSLVYAAAGGWLVGLSAVFVTLDAFNLEDHQRVVALVPGIPGLVLLAIAIRRQRRLTRWLRRVRRGKVRGWRIVANEPIAKTWTVDWLFVRPDAQRSSGETLIQIEKDGQTERSVARLACREQFGALRSVLLAGGIGLLRIAAVAALLYGTLYVASVVSEGERFKNRATGQEQPRDDAR